MKRVLILGSAPDAVQAKQIDFSGFSAIIAINNAWQILDNWTHLVHPEDFALERRPTPKSNQTIITHAQYVPANNAFGGIVYAGGTMAFTAAYWALHALQPDIMVFCGCDMVYDTKTQTHFYGNGEADPLRADPTLQSLEAKANRLMLMAANRSCLCVNFFDNPKSRLTFEPISPAYLAPDRVEFLSDARSLGLQKLQMKTDKTKMEAALIAEAKAECFVPTGDYWNYPEKRDANTLAQIDALWLETVNLKTTS
ncbi:MAG: hypothetical protein AB8B49_09830 [Nitratireductor sp.]